MPSPKGANMNMRKTIPWLVWMPMLALSLSCLTLAGCDDDDDNSSGGTTIIVVTNVVNGTVTTNVVTTTNAPAAGDVSGVWATHMTQPDGDPNWEWDVDVTIVQTGQDVQGSFRAGTAQTFTGTYVGGTMTATDTLDCLWQIDFSGNEGEGTRTRHDIPVTVVRMTRAVPN